MTDPISPIRAASLQALHPTQSAATGASGAGDAANPVEAALADQFERCMDSAQPMQDSSLASMQMPATMENGLWGQMLGSNLTGGGDHDDDDD